jgi:HlyD family secretion protein
MAQKFAKRFTQFVQQRWKLLAALLAVLLVLFLGSRVLAGRTTRAQSANLQTALVERGNLTATVGATGSIRALQSAMLIWKTSGTVEKVNVAVGDNVSSDDILANLELSSLPQNVILASVDLEEAQNGMVLNLANSATALAVAQNTLDDAQRILYNLTHPGKQVDIDQAYANMVLAKDQLDTARDNYEPYAKKPQNNLARANFLLRFTEAQQRYDSAVRVYNSFVGTANAIDIAVAEGNVAVAKAHLELAQQDYDAAVSGPNSQSPSEAEARLAAAQSVVGLANIKAPFAGTITDAYPHQGDIVSSGVVAFQLDDLNHLQVDVEVSEVDINRVQVGQTATLTLDAAPDTEYTGKVVAVAMAGVVDQGAVNFRVTVQLSDADEFVLPGMTAAVNIVVTELQDVLLVPNRAVRFQDGDRIVYVLRNGVTLPITITLGASSETYSEVVSGDLQEGDTIILNPATTSFDPSQRPQGGQFLIGGGN